VAGRETTVLPGNLQLPIIFYTSPVTVSAEAPQIQALEICQVFMKDFVLKERNIWKIQIKRLIIKCRKKVKNGK